MSDIPVPIFILYMAMIIIAGVVALVTTIATLRVWDWKRRDKTGQIRFLYYLLLGTAMGQSLRFFAWLVAVWLTQHDLTEVWLALLLGAQVLEGSAVVIFSLYTVGLFNTIDKPTGIPAEVVLVAGQVKVEADKLDAVIQEAKVSEEKESGDGKSVST